MASPQAYLLDFITRWRFKRSLSTASGLMRAREIMAGITMKVRADVDFRTDTVGGVAGEWAEAHEGSGPVLLYLHGGGYFACSARTHRPITAAFAQQGFAVFTPDYRLAPEHPHPAAIEDGVSVWAGLLARGHAALGMALAGDSAGGGLALAVLLTLRDRGVALPAAAALLSPWADLSMSGATIVSNARRDAMFTMEGFRTCAGMYLRRVDPKMPSASPVFADLCGLPPMILHVGEREMLRDDSARVARSVSACGGIAELKIFPVVPHVWQLAQFVPEARISIREMATFLNRYFIK